MRGSSEQMIVCVIASGLFKARRIIEEHRAEIASLEQRSDQ
jgi:hypothetical protein